MRRAGAVGALVLALTACSPVGWVITTTKTGNTTNYVVKAKAGPSDNGGSSFRAAVVCDGVVGWNLGRAINVDTATPDAAGYFTSTAQCFDNRVIVGKNVERW